MGQGEGDAGELSGAYNTGKAFLMHKSEEDEAKEKEEEAELMVMMKVTTLRQENCGGKLRTWLSLGRCRSTRQMSSVSRLEKKRERERRKERERERKKERKKVSEEREGKRDRERGKGERTRNRKKGRERTRVQTREPLREPSRKRVPTTVGAENFSSLNVTL